MRTRELGWHLSCTVIGGQLCSFGLPLCRALYYYPPARLPDFLLGVLTAHCLQLASGDDCQVPIAGGGNAASGAVDAVDVGTLGRWRWRWWVGMAGDLAGSATITLSPPWPPCTGPAPLSCAIAVSWHNECKRCSYGLHAQAQWCWWWSAAGPARVAGSESCC